MNICTDIQQAAAGPVANPESGVYRGEFFFPENHPVFSGHFPAYPLLPGVYLLQSLWYVARPAWAQAPVLVSVQSARFSSQVRPPCRYTAKVVIQARGAGWRVKGEIVVGGEVAAQAVLDVTAPLPK